MSLFFQRPLSNFELFWNTACLFILGPAEEWEVGKNILTVVSVFLRKSLHLPKPCLCSYKIGSIILCILGRYGPCEVLDVIPGWSQDVDVLDRDRPLRKIRGVLGLCWKGNMLKRLSCAKLGRRQDMIHKGPSRSEAKETKWTQASKSKLRLEAKGDKEV